MSIWPQQLLRTLIVAGACCAVPASAINIDIRLMCEVTGGCAAGDFFFDYPEALPALEFAAKAFEPFADELTAIPASPSWTASFTNPETGSGYSLSNLSVPANTLILYAGGGDFDANNPEAVNQVGQAGPGTSNLPFTRGQGIVSGSAARDFGPWGGAISFDTLNNGVPRNWHFGIHTFPGPGQIDFLTIAFHELAHVFGFGTAESFDNLVTSNHFQGSNVVGLTGSAAALTPDFNHWASGTTSPPYADEPPSALTAQLVLGRRTLLTPLDFAALADLGWEVPDKLLGLHGDNDQDGDVDGRDFLLWQRSFGTSGPNLAGDANGDLHVDEFDLWLWEQNHGEQLASPSLSGTIQVPEPCGLIVGFGIACLLLRRRFD